MKKHKHDKKLPPEAFSGNTQEPFNQEEAPHRHLARGALSKAARRYKDGEISPDDFDKHVARAHNRLSEYPVHAIAIPLEHKRKK